jgi:hypothetical protein
VTLIRRTLSNAEAINPAIAAPPKIKMAYCSRALAATPAKGRVRLFDLDLLGLRNIAVQEKADNPFIGAAERLESRCHIAFGGGCFLDLRQHRL